jgi:twitching motility two-component system response regulator PilG
MQRRQLRVMVLDTSPTSRKVLEVILRREGHRVVCFGDPLEALRFLSQHGPADLLFLGLDLPGMDGVTVLKYVKREPSLRATVLIALLEGDDGILTRILARLAGAERMVTKPLERQQIVALVSEILMRLEPAVSGEQGAAIASPQTAEAASGREAEE